MKRLNVGFRTEAFGPFAYLFKKIAREKYGLDLYPVPKFGKGEEAELSILGGELDFVLGNHYTPLAAKARGVHICWLAIPVLEHDYKLVTRSEIQSTDELKGRTFLLPEGRCPALNMILVLRQMGLEGKIKLEILKADRGDFYHTSPLLLKIKDREADATLVDSPVDIIAERLGLRVFDTPKLAIVSGPCITTTPAFARKDPVLTKDMLRAYLESIHDFKTDKKSVLDILRAEGSRASTSDPELIDAWYESRAKRMEPRPFPTPLSLEWTQAKAAIDYPEAVGINAVRLLELDYLLELDQEGFVDRLWSQR